VRSRPLYSTLFIILAAAIAAAQQVQRAWLRIQPEGEEFAVHMPEPHWRIRRALPFGGATLKPISFEVTNRGVLFSVLSFSKSEPAAPKTLDALVAGLRTAFGERAALEFEREVKLDGRAGMQFRLKGEGGRGAARVYETERHFYVVMTYGHAEAAAASAHFQNSFTFDTAGADRVPLGEEVDVSDLSVSPAATPAPLWPPAGIAPVVGVASRTIEGAGAPATSGAGATRQKIVSGGVLNGKAVAKPVPAYPPVAKAARADGTVTVQILVDEEGYVIAATPVSGHPLLQRPAALAARQARFTPTLLEGQPVKVSGVITYNFVLQ